MTRFARVYTPLVTVAAVLLAVLIPLAGCASWAEGLRRACNFLIVSCPCALVLSVPLGFFGGIGAASRMGVLVKGADALETAAALTTLAMDKTGTLTTGHFGVTEVGPAVEGLSPEALLEMAAHGESGSTHPVALSIREAWGKATDPARVGETLEVPGRGLKVVLDGKNLLVGNAQLLEDEGMAVCDAAPGRTLVHVVHDALYLASLAAEEPDVVEHPHGVHLVSVRFLKAFAALHVLVYEIGQSTVGVVALNLVDDRPYVPTGAHVVADVLLLRIYVVVGLHCVFRLFQRVGYLVALALYAGVDFHSSRVGDAFGHVFQHPVVGLSELREFVSACHVVHRGRYEVEPVERGEYMTM